MRGLFTNTDKSSHGGYPQDTLVALFDDGHVFHGDEISEDDKGVRKFHIVDFPDMALKDYQSKYNNREVKHQFAIDRTKCTKAETDAIDSPDIITKDKTFFDKSILDSETGKTPIEK